MSGIAEMKQQHLEKVDLSKDRKKYDLLADLFSIIITVEHLEIVWARGCCEDDEYTQHCQKLITRYKSMLPSIEYYYPKIDDFFKEYCPDAHAARNRLVNKGVPATTFHGSAQPGKLDNAKSDQLVIAQTVQYFITTVDGLQLSLKAVDEIHPHLKDLMESINKIKSLPPDHVSKTKVQEWLIKLNQMKAADELKDDDIRQMTFDLENAYAEFVKFLQSGN
eukprot:CAMPEP_0202712768 /NCGR_PEP_ID=MMETSP1385-20130828/45207_1 /ASSEMBLY_ACC=CAM_ASM_000861 /TAXON_ID=933848 /ORGANISM="Elphidium margaritaceum" /LENGTH=220 /DNA_ID=CAMNT_0049372899 /DNA_START=41 /DNA_END=703 /DNA_ORIENTATION=+